MKLEKKIRFYEAIKLKKFYLQICKGKNFELATLEEITKISWDRLNC